MAGIPAICDAFSKIEITEGINVENIDGFFPDALHYPLKYIHRNAGPADHTMNTECNEQQLPHIYSIRQYRKDFHAESNKKF